MSNSGKMKGVLIRAATFITLFGINTHLDRGSRDRSLFLGEDVVSFYGVSSI
jgi:hypothetical protein